ncbi:putative glycerol kinase 5 isoform X2 [Eurytemora carolleeae]|uniref:putative glycerol kinase 5 isoform X2 n=1 Tax=Eurytemora carolleeae TaxID=1294199 RepID=UPI000C75C27A|nr:putative glycerol kinase 5 isoform X2 [Eurytemora carolleeae]|eukprot:XP_023326829.1 putative glycerol kinase 5 isoform X2 [Eurytemora affinis]
MMSKYVLGLDVGTTTLRSFLYNNKGEVCYSCVEKVDLVNPKPGWVEIDPDILWNKVVKVLETCVSNVPREDVSGLGISCQRGTFTCWSKSTGRPFHNLITWKDLRADSLVKMWNKSFSIRALRLGGKILHWITRMPRYQAASIFTLFNGLVILRLVWALDNIPGLREAAQKDDLMFGCVDSWLLYNLTGKHMTEISNIAATGMFDPFTMEYASWIYSLFNIPESMMPRIVSSCGDHFGSTSADLLGISIPIRAVLADQSASVFGSGCTQLGAAKITMGTGSFIDVVTASAHASMNGLIPIIGWKIKEEVVHLAEGSVHDTGVILDWGRSVQLFDDFNDISEIVNSVADCGGVYFVPGFNGMQKPVLDPSATAECIAFTQKQLVDSFLTESNYKIDKLVVDGGVAQNDFILQYIADLTGLPVERPENVEMSAWGTAALAGIQVGLWKNREELNSLRSQGTFFTRNPGNTRCLSDYKAWQKACLRFTKWKQEEEENA